MILTTQTPYCVVEENSGIIEHQGRTYYISRTSLILNAVHLIERKI